MIKNGQGNTKLVKQSVLSANVDKSNMDSTSDENINDPDQAVLHTKLPFLDFLSRLPVHPFLFK